MGAEPETSAGGDAYDIAVIGAGAAGLHVAIEAAERGARACIVSRKPLSESASYWAQGGLAAALAPDDSPERHAEDTLNAGRGLCRPSAVEVLVREAPLAVEALISRGVRFDLDPVAPGSGAEDAGGLALGLEGGHSARRIVHAGGAETGRALTSRLAELAAAHDRIDVVERTSALALASDGERCGGFVTDRGSIRARATVLATGGGAALWSRTTNPWGAVGAGAVLAQAAGAELADLELCQFHPTALALPGAERDGALVTEAVRGEGATLLDANGRRFTDELAPRDQVTAAILDRMDADRAPHVWLDLRSLRPEAFPSVFATIRAAGLDPAAQPVPVAPAAHYLIGGIATDLDGRTSLAGLYAVGECACTGLHGANRLASNSLSECFVFGARAAAAAVSEPDPPPGLADPGWRFTPPTVDTRAALWRFAGPRRSAEGLEHLLDDPYPLARLIAASAIARRESRGVHRRVDFPRLDPQLDGIHFLVAADETQRSERWA
ncbi:MAG TPA: FAD-dependent oxidoreductase [Solirubrobacterales bacterium]